MLQSLFLQLSQICQDIYNEKLCTYKLYGTKLFFLRSWLNNFPDLDVSTFMALACLAMFVSTRTYQV